MAFGWQCIFREQRIKHLWGHRRYVGVKASEVHITINGIRELKARNVYHRWVSLRHTGLPVWVSISADFSANRSKNVCVMTLGAHYRTLRSQIMRDLLDYFIEVTFDVDDLGTLIDEADGEMLVPKGLLSLMLGIGIGALRGMLALRTSGTFLVHYPLPIISIADMIDSMDGANGLPSVKYELPLEPVES